MKIAPLSPPADLIQLHQALWENSHAKRFYKTIDVDIPHIDNPEYVCDAKFTLTYLDLTDYPSIGRKVLVRNTYVKLREEIEKIFADFCTVYHSYDHFAVTDQPPIVCMSNQLMRASVHADTCA